MNSKSNMKRRPQFVIEQQRSIINNIQAHTYMWESDAKWRMQLKNEKRSEAEEVSETTRFDNMRLNIYNQKK